jgi:hypothetical protein
MKVKYGLIFLLSSALLGCADGDSTHMISLQGKWVDVAAKTDTLTFNPDGTNNFLVLARGKENKGGFLRPKPGSGPYFYELGNDESISLRWSLSSYSGSTAYYFKQHGRKLTIEKFFDVTTPGVLLTFEKIE